METEFSVMDGTRTLVSPAQTVTGVLTRARQPAPWIAPQTAPDQIPTHRLLADESQEDALAVGALVTGIARERYLRDPDGRVFALLGRQDVDPAAYPGAKVWLLRAVI